MRTHTTPVPGQVTTGFSKRWSIILAGGDGTRLLPLTRKLTGDERPKQFCALNGGATLLEQTIRRVDGLTPAGQSLVVLTDSHRRYFEGQLDGLVPASHRLVQPHNHGTAAAIAWSSIRARELDEHAIIACLPSDHHFGNEQAFRRHLDAAFAHAETHPESVVLLGIEPEAPEESYGWIEPGSPLSPGSPVLSVKRFWEKPSRALAMNLMTGRCLWNSFVMVGTAAAFVRLIWRTLPELMFCFDGASADAQARAWFDLPAFNFSDRVLAARASDLAVIRAAGLEWSDLGEPQRVLSVFGAPVSGTAPFPAYAFGA